MDVKSSLTLAFLLILLVICSIGGQVRFGDVRTVLRLSHTFPSLNETGIFFIKQDLEDSTKFFIGANNSILSARFWPENQRQLKVIVGSVFVSGYGEGEGTEARFRTLLDLVQTNDGLVVTDAPNHCLRLIHPPTASSTKWSTSTYAGRCLFAGSVDGNFLDARFGFPYGLLKHDNFIFLSDFFNKKLQKLDTTTREISTIYQSANFQLRYFLFGNEPNEFYTTVNHGVLRIHEGKESWLVGWAKERFQQEKALFSTAEFGMPRTIAQLSDKILLIADGETYTLKVINIAAQEVDTICPLSGYVALDGDNKRCVLVSPRGLLVLNNTILIGERGGIRSLEYETLEVEPTATSTATTSTGLQTTTAPFSFGQCGEPPSTSNAYFQPRENYPEGSTVFYRCTDGYTKSVGGNNTMVCISVKGEFIWIGVQIECLPSPQMVTASVLAAICICTVIAIAVTAVKIRSINKQLEEATGRQTQINTTSGSGCSNQIFEGEERVRHKNCRNQAQYISIIPDFPARREPRPHHSRRGPKAASRRVNQLQRE